MRDRRRAVVVAMAAFIELGFVRPTRDMNAKSIIHALLLTGYLGFQPQLFGQETARYALPDDAAKAWAEVEKVHQALRPPKDWQMHEPTAEQVAEFQRQVRQTAVSFADKSREFIERFPTNENIGDARITVVYSLGHAVAAGDVDAEKRILEPGLKHPAEMAKIASVSELYRAPIVFQNNSAGIRKVYWLDYNGERRRYCELKPQPRLLRLPTWRVG